MGLAFYDDQLVVFSTNPLRSFHDGHLGDVHEQLIHIRNDDSALYYTNLTLEPEVSGGPNTGWSIKLAGGTRRPTEAEWDIIEPDSLVNLDDLGDTSAADTSTYLPVWVRIVCPGDEPAKILENQSLKLKAYERNVGS